MDRIESVSAGDSVAEEIVLTKRTGGGCELIGFMSMVGGAITLLASDGTALAAGVPAVAGGAALFAIGWRR